MPIERHEFTCEATSGTMREFGSMTLVENIMSGELNDGRKVEVLRSATGHPYFEIRVDGVDRHMRINMMDAILSLAEKLSEITTDVTGEAS